MQSKIEWERKERWTGWEAGMKVGTRVGMRSWYEKLVWEVGMKSWYEKLVWEVGMRKKIYMKLRFTQQVWKARWTGWEVGMKSWYEKLVWEVNMKWEIGIRKFLYEIKVYSTSSEGAMNFTKLVWEFGMRKFLYEIKVYSTSSEGAMNYAKLIWEVGIRIWYKNWYEKIFVWN